MKIPLRIPSAALLVCGRPRENPTTECEGSLMVEYPSVRIGIDLQWNDDFRDCDFGGDPSACRADLTCVPGTLVEDCAERGMECVPGLGADARCQ